MMLRPRFWAGHLAMVVCLSAAVGLGLWQLDAWHTRRADAARHISAQPAVPLGSVMTGDSSFPGRSLGRQVTFGGSWIGASTLYVSDRYLGNSVGYWVVTPVLVDGTSSAMPVVRGWSRTHSSTIPSGHVAITGWLQATEGNGPFDPNPNDSVIPTMRIASIVQHVNADLYSGFVVANVARSTLGAFQAGISPVSAAAIPQVSSFTALRNLLYAIEWWVFGGFAVFVWVRWCRDSFGFETGPVEA
jgi:surfeit locus 1 family protein